MRITSGTSAPTITYAVDKWKLIKLQTLLNDQKFWSGLWVQKLLLTREFWIDSETCISVQNHHQSVLPTNQASAYCQLLIWSLHLLQLSVRLLLPPHWLQHFPCKILYFWTPLGGLKEAQDAVYNVTTFFVPLINPKLQRLNAILFLSRSTTAAGCTSYEFWTLINHLSSDRKSGRNQGVRWPEEIDR